MTWPADYSGSAAAGPSGVVHVKASVANGGSASGNVCISFNVTAPDGSLAGSAKASAPVKVAPGESATIEA